MHSTTRYYKTIYNTKHIHHSYFLINQSNNMSAYLNTRLMPREAIPDVIVSNLPNTDPIQPQFRMFLEAHTFTHSLSRPIKVVVPSRTKNNLDKRDRATIEAFVALEDQHEHDQLIQTLNGAIFLERELRAHRNPDRFRRTWVPPFLPTRDVHVQATTDTPLLDGGRLMSASARDINQQLFRTNSPAYTFATSSARSSSTSVLTATSLYKALDKHVPNVGNQLASRSLSQRMPTSSPYVSNEPDSDGWYDVKPLLGETDSSLTMAPLADGRADDAHQSRARVRKNLFGVNEDETPTVDIRTYSVDRLTGRAQPKARASRPLLFPLPRVPKKKTPSTTPADLDSLWSAEVQDDFELLQPMNQPSLPEDWDREMLMEREWGLTWPQM